MNMTALEIGLAIGEAGGALEGAFPNKIFQTGREEWVLEFRKGGDRFWLAISISAKNGRIHLIKSAPACPLPLDGFARNLKKTILRGKVLSLRQISGDRVVQIVLGGAGGEMTLTAEIMGTASNAYLLDHEGKVGAMAHPRKGRAELGGEYAPPQQHERKSPAREEPALEPIQGEPFPVNAALELRHEAPAMEERLDDARVLICRPLREDLKKMERHARNLEEEMASLQGFKECGRLADLIKANYHSIKKGMEKAEVENLFSPGMERIIIPLDPAKGVEGNAEAYYKKYRKFEKGAPRIEAELALLKAKGDEIRERINLINSADTLEKLAGFLPKEDPAGQARGAKAPAGKAGGGKKEQKAQSGPKRFVSSEGHLILVGRNDAENDELTFKIANGRDLWLHARDYPGSHVIARMPKGAEPSRKTLLEAAMIALHYSKAAKAGKGEVTYCLAKEVKKPKGAPPGKVLVHGAKSVSARIDEAVIKAMKERRS